MFCGHRQGEAAQGVQYIVKACVLYHARGIEYNECKNALMRPAGNQRFPGDLRLTKGGLRVDEEERPRAVKRSARVRHNIRIGRCK